MIQLEFVDYKNNNKSIEKCNDCGSKDLYYDISSGKIKCQYCLKEYEGTKFNNYKNTKTILNKYYCSNSILNKKSTNQNFYSIKCGSCGAIININDKQEKDLNCPWCNSILSINDKHSTILTPDSILPFKVTKEEAYKNIKDFLKDKRFFATREFKKNFKLDNIKPIYLPYIIVNGKAKPLFEGNGEIVLRTYSEGGEDANLLADIDYYKVKRCFNIDINGLTIESNKEYSDKYVENRTNNILNAIMPFDIENVECFQPCYLDDCYSEDNDIDIDPLVELIVKRFKDIARFSINETLKKYTDGVVWEKQDINVEGFECYTAYLPVWICSYLDKDKTLHYFAVNGRSGKTMGSVPFEKRLMVISLIVLPIILLFATMIMCFITYDSTYNTIPKVFSTSFLLSIVYLCVGAVIFMRNYPKYRNREKRFRYEIETSFDIKNIESEDHIIESKTGIIYHPDYHSDEMNNRIIEGDYIYKNKFLDNSHPNKPS